MVRGHVWDEDEDGNGNGIVERRRSLVTHQLAPVRCLGVEMQSEGAQSTEYRDARQGAAEKKRKGSDAPVVGRCVQFF